MVHKGEQVRRWMDSAEWPACDDWRLLCWCKDAVSRSISFRVYLPGEDCRPVFQEIVDHSQTMVQ